MPKIPRTVVILGLVSFFNDLASEMVTPLIPILLVTVLGAGPVALGLVEGVADAVASALKLWSGRFSDVLGGKRKWLTFNGYLLSNLARPLLGQATGWPGVAFLRGLDRVGKGIRTAPRDALVADATPPAIRGLAYGFHRALDNGGAMAGSLLAAAVLAWSDLSLAEVILWSAIPGAMGVLLVAFGIREPASPPAPRPVLPPLRWSLLSPTLRRYLLVLALFTFARASETFIVLRGYEMGMGVVELLLLWSALSLAKAVSSFAGGHWSDGWGTGNLVLVGWLGYALGFALLGMAADAGDLWPMAIIYGVLAGLSEGGERSLISAYTSTEERGTAFGWYHMVLGFAAIPAGLLFGSVWHYFDAAAAFTMAAGLAVLAALLLYVWVNHR